MVTTTAAATDPRKRRAAEAAAAPAAPPPKAPILLGGEDAMEVDEVIPSPPITATEAAPVSADDEQPSLAVALISRIMTPSPYPQHNSGPESVRFRTAFHRVTTNPTSDVEAWQALMSEVKTCYRQIASVHAVNAETQAQLDWAESCYGALLKNFPYAASYYVTILEMLLSQSARVGEEHGPLVDYFGTDAVPRRAIRCEQKAEAIFQKVLGYHMDGTPVKEYELVGGGICVWSVELWLLYIQKVVRDANRKASSLSVDERAAFVREATKKAYELAVSNAGFCQNNHLLWKQYLAFCKSWIPDPTENTDHALATQQMEYLRSIYQELISHPMTGLDQLWHEYEAFERGLNDTLAQELIPVYLPKYQHARTVYLERDRVYGAVGLNLGRLATEPIAQQQEKTDEDYASKMEDEYKVLKLWKTRCAYERTNPERLSATDLAQRIRSAYKEMASVLTRHPECWHMWSMWELLGPESKSPDKATAVLQLAQEHIPDCTLLAHAEAHVAELFTDNSSNCITVMERFLEHSPNTLGFVLYQQMVRRYKGVDAARAVFSKARRVLVVDAESGGAVGIQGEKKDATEATAEGDVEAATTEAADQSGSKTTNDDGKRWVVTNRLDPAIGKQNNALTKEEQQEGEEVTNDGGDIEKSSNDKSPRGNVTWHLYAAHANMEHRLNHAPDIAARVYELGLRKHASFLTSPAYVMRYAQLLLELGDTNNLRALLTRAVAACEAQEKHEALASLWDINLRFESVMSADKTSASHVQDIERKRWQALMGADVEDVATGGYLASSDTPQIGAQKSTIAEQLVRSEGYDVSSSIVSGMSRAVDVLDVMGLWGSGNPASSLSRQKSKQDKDAEISGGRSDASYQKRLEYQNLAAAGLSTESAVGDGAGFSTGSKLLTARERLQQGSAVSAAGPAQSSAIMIAIQQSPEWIRPLLLQLPASKLRLPIVAKPLPHLTELALSSLRQNPLPAERPKDTANGPNKRSAPGGGGDSSDEENDFKMKGGYGNQFRHRQRARMSGQQNGSGDN